MRCGLMGGSNEVQSDAYRRDEVENEIHGMKFNVMRCDAMQLDHCFTINPFHLITIVGKLSHLAYLFFF